MIDLTPLDVRKKAGDFTKSLRGYDPQQVESFLELAAERLEELVKENLTLKERVERLAEQVEAQSGREKAVNDALVTAQQLREEISASAEREADALRAEAKVQADRIRSAAEDRARRLVADAEDRLSDLRQASRELTRRRARFLANFRQLLERELDVVEMQEADTVEEYMVVGLGAELSGTLADEARPAATEDGEQTARPSDDAGEITATGHAPATDHASEDAAPAEGAAPVEDVARAEDAARAEADLGPTPPASDRARWTRFEYAADDEDDSPGSDTSEPDADR